MEKLRLTDGTAKTKSGVTLLESVVLIAMFTIVSAVVLASFSGMNEGVALNRAARELALGIRKAQQIALAVKQLPGGVSPPRAGIQLSINAGKYTLFADVDGDFRYVPTTQGGQDIDIEELEHGRGTPEGKFERGVVINGFEREDGTAIPLLSTVNIMFSSPEATTDFSDADGISISATEPFIAVVLKSPSGKTKKVNIRISGQVTVP